LLSSGYGISQLVSEFARILPVALIVLALAVAGFRPLVRRLGTHPVVAAGLLLTAAGIAVVTLTKAPYIVGSTNGGSGFCLNAGWQPDLLPWPFTGGINGRSLNVWMFVPLGVFCALTGTRSVAGRPPNGWTPLAATALGALAPMCIEAAQRTLPLARLCDTRDVADNTYGLLIGAALGLAVREILLRARPRTLAPVS
jgi:hypothetical protein